ncbi:MAG: hypothetical protein DRI57_26155 [Deltaproteobacteria bacterium]|nr:MAG: hypothetical protein DRI57_26155 [Deltaproteobacteria bacterium]
MKLTTYEIPHRNASDHITGANVSSGGVHQQNPEVIAPDQNNLTGIAHTIYHSVMSIAERYCA